VDFVRRDIVATGRTLLFSHDPSCFEERGYVLLSAGIGAAVMVFGHLTPAVMRQ